MSSRKSIPSNHLLLSRKRQQVSVVSHEKRKSGKKEKEGLKVVTYDVPAAVEKRNIITEEMRRWIKWSFFPQVKCFTINGNERKELSREEMLVSGPEGPPSFSPLPLLCVLCIVRELFPLSRGGRWAIKCGEQIWMEKNGDHADDEEEQIFQCQYFSGKRSIGIIKNNLKNIIPMAIINFWSDCFLYFLAVFAFIIIRKKVTKPSLQKFSKKGFSKFLLVAILCLPLPPVLQSMTIAHCRSERNSENTSLALNFELYNIFFGGKERKRRGEKESEGEKCEGDGEGIWLAWMARHHRLSRPLLSFINIWWEHSHINNNL